VLGLGFKIYIMKTEEYFNEGTPFQNMKPALSKDAVGGSNTVKDCQNCKFYTADRNRCNHDYWNLCIKRDDEGYVTSYVYHHYR
jgi:hypothetical protein